MDPEVHSADAKRNDGPVRRRRRRRLVIISLLLFCSLLTWSLQSKPPVIEAVSPGGSFKIRFVAGGIGRIDHRPHSSLYVWFHGLAKTYAPVVLFKQLPKPRNVFLEGEPATNGSDPLMVMFDIQPLGRRVHGDDYQAFFNVAFVFEESTSYSVERECSRRIVSAGQAFCFDVFPRRDRMVKLHLVEKESRRPLMSIAIRNDKPSTDQYSQTPTAIPVVLATPEVECTLKDLRLGQGLATGKMIPVFDVNPIDASWKSHLVESALEDASGNRGDSLSPFESCWKVTARISRRVEADFSPREMWQSRAFAIPDERTAMTLGFEGQIDSTSIKLLCIKGLGMGQVQEASGEWNFSGHPVDSAISLPVPGAKPGTRRFVNIRMPFTKQPFVLLDVDGLMPDEHLLVLVRDQDGTIIGRASDPRTRFNNGTRCRCAIEFEPRKTTKEVTTTVMVSKPKVFDFYVKPPAELREKPAKAGME